MNIETVTEAEADQATAMIFADIRATMGVALVNLIWRHLASSPAALTWCWQSLKPLYASGVVPQAAWTLRDALALPQLSAFNQEDRRALGNDVKSLGVIDAVLRTYERGNAQNLVALCALRQKLAQTPNAAVSDSRQRAKLRALEESREELADRITEPLPPLPSMNELSASVRADIESLAAIWVPEDRRGLIPSVFRHLAHWPAVLTIYRDKLQALQDESMSMAAFAAAAIEQATAHAGPLGGQLGDATPLDAPTQRWLNDALDLFIDGMIGYGVVIVPAMRKVLPRQ